MALERTTLMPSEIQGSEGRIDKMQKDVEGVIDFTDGPVPAGDVKTIREALAPGKYKVVVTAENQTAPVATSIMITLARRMGTRTVPEAMRLLANQGQKVFRRPT
jgi:hypothetical protein